MRKILIITAVVFTILGIVFTILPMGSIALIPICIAIILAALSLWKSNNLQRKAPKWVLIISVLILLVAGCKIAFVKDKVVVDQQFIQENVDSKAEAQKELEGL